MNGTSDSLILYFFHMSYSLNSLVFHWNNFLNENIFCNVYRFLIVVMELESLRIFVLRAHRLSSHQHIFYIFLDSTHTCNNFLASFWLCAWSYFLFIGKKDTATTSLLKQSKSWVEYQGTSNDTHHHMNHKK